MKPYTLLLLAGALALSACSGDGGSTANAFAATVDMIAVADTGQVPVFRRVWDDAPRKPVNPSPDGRYLTYVGNGVTIRDLVTGQERRVTPEQEDADWAEVPYFSPDGRHVAYMWGAMPPGPSAYSLKMVEVGDTVHRTLLTTGEEWGKWWGPMDWTEDQGMLLEFNSHGASGDEFTRTALATFMPGDETVRILWEFEEGSPHPHNGKFSPDGRYAAFNLAGGDVFTIPTSGGELTNLGIGPGQVLGWTGTGELIVHTDGPAAGGIWSVPMDDGRPSGEPVLLKGNVHALIASDPSDDAFFYKLVVDAPKVFAATIDVEHGGFVVAPTPVTSIADGAVYGARWSPDGRSFVYGRLRSPDEAIELVLQSWDGRDVRVIATVDRLDGLRGLRWDPDGQSVLFRSGNVIHRVDIATGQVATVLDEDVVADLNNTWTITLDGRSVLATRGGSADPMTLVSVDLETGTERTVATFPAPGWGFSIPTVSPDGRTVALRGQQFSGGPGALFVVSTDGGEFREILNVEGDSPTRLRGFPNWTPDGETLLVGLGTSLIAVPLAGGQYRVVLDEVERSVISLHPDGRRILFVAGQFAAEMWTMEQVPSIR